jgi:hypothetical protein
MWPVRFIDVKYQTMANPTKEQPEELGEYAGGEIKDRPGKVDWWLAVVYLVLLVWGLYYLVTGWGGLGPGLDY